MLKRAVNPKNRVPTRFRNRLHPVILLTSRQFRPEIDINRTIGINQKPLSLTTDTVKLSIEATFKTQGTYQGTCSVRVNQVNLS